MKIYSHYLIVLFFLFLFSCRTQYIPIESGGHFVQIKSSIQEKDTISKISLLLKPYQDSIHHVMYRNIGYATGDFKKGKPISSLGNLIVNILYEKGKELGAAKIDNVIYNYGGIRIPEIAKGEIRIETIYELLPFDNEMVFVEVPGFVLKKWYALIAESGGWPMYYSFQKKNEGVANWEKKSDTLLQTFFRNNQLETDNTFYIQERKPIDDSALYTIITNDYIANGGDQCDFLRACKQIQTGLMIRDIAIEQINKYKKIYPSSYTQLIKSN